MEGLSSKLDLPGALDAALCYYPPGLRHEAHNHRIPHVSVVVAGSFREATPHGEWTVCHGSVGFRADDSRHAVRFGPAGALILNLAIGDWRGAGTPRAGVRWIEAPAAFARDLLDLAGSGRADAGAELADRLVDAWAAATLRGRRGRRHAPAWLREAAERLIEAPHETSIAALASRLGVHRVYFARQFQRHHGMAPSAFRRRAMASRALSSGLVRGARLAHAAADAGFADQSHMARAMRETCAMSVRDIRRLLLGEVASVQAGIRAGG